MLLYECLNAILDNDIGAGVAQLAEPLALNKVVGGSKPLARSSEYSASGIVSQHNCWARSEGMEYHHIVRWVIEGVVVASGKNDAKRDVWV